MVSQTETIVWTNYIYQFSGANCQFQGGRLMMMMMMMMMMMIALNHDGYFQVKPTFATIFKLAQHTHFFWISKMWSFFWVSVSIATSCSWLGRFPFCVLVSGMECGLVVERTVRSARMKLNLDFFGILFMDHKWTINDYLGGNSNIFLCSSRKFGEMIQFDVHIFQMGWFNHQPDEDVLPIEKGGGTRDDPLLACFTRGFTRG